MRRPPPERATSTSCLSRGSVIGVLQRKREGSCPAGVGRAIGEPHSGCVGIEQSGLRVGVAGGLGLDDLGVMKWISSSSLSASRASRHWSTPIADAIAGQIVRVRAALGIQRDGQAVQLRPAARRGNASARSGRCRRLRGRRSRSASIAASSSRAGVLGSCAPSARSVSATRSCCSGTSRSSRSSLRSSSEIGLQLGLRVDRVRGRNDGVGGEAAAAGAVVRPGRPAAADPAGSGACRASSRTRSSTPVRRASVCR